MKNNWAQSSDGSLSAYNAEFDECYHSLKDGALNETLHKHIYPALHSLENLGVVCKPEVSLRVLDVCFGLGYNTLTLLAFLIQEGYRGRVEVFSPEKDEVLFHSLLEFQYPDMLVQSLPMIGSIMHTFAHSEYGALRMYEGEMRGLSFAIYLYRGDALEFLSDLTQRYPQQINVIFQDPFSPRKNPELWSREYFCTLASLLHHRGIITTYSQSSAIRQNAIESGLEVYNYESGVVRGGSVMGWCKPGLESLTRVLPKESSRVFE